MHAKLSAQSNRMDILKIGIVLTLLVFPYCYSIASVYSPARYSDDKIASMNQLKDSSYNGAANGELLTPSYSPASAENRVIAILIDLADVANSTTSKTINSTIFAKMASYFDVVSYQELSVIGNVTDWISVSNTTVQYGKNTSEIDDVDGDGIPDSWWLIRDAVHLIDNITNFARYDTVIAVHSGQDEAASGAPNDIWSAYYSGLEISTNDGITITTGIVISELDPMGIFAHEFGHALGLPDLYNANGGSEFVGKWDLMADGAWLGSPAGESPSHPTSYCRMLLGWISDSWIMAGRNLQGVIDHLEVRGSNFSAMKIPVTTDTYYLVEVRQKIGYDAYLPGAGVLILYVDDTLPSGGGIVVVKYWLSLDQATYTAEPGRNVYVDDSRNINVTVLSAYSSSYRVAVNLIRQDDTPPTIELTDPVPWTWQTSWSAAVGAVITDVGTNSSSVKNATLFYSSDEGGSWNRIQMAPSSGDFYSAVIPSQNSSPVLYYLEAYDYAGNLGIADNGGQYYVYGNADETIAVIVVAIVGIGMVCVLALALSRRRRAGRVAHSDAVTPRVYVL